MAHPVVPVKDRAILVASLGLKGKDAEVWHSKWRSVLVRAKRRQLPCTLSFKQYLKLAIRADLTSPHEIGRRNHEYNLSRYGDVGGYTWGNCRFILAELNREERVTNGGIERGAAKRRGLTKLNCAWRAEIARKQEKSFTIVSPSGKVMRGSNLTEFCRKHSLSPGCVNKVIAGARSNTKGWTQYVKD